MRATLAKRFQRPPSDGDVIWGCLNARAVTYAAQSMWGLYTNNSLDLAIASEREGRTSQALIFLFSHCYLALNGPQNGMRVNFDGQSHYLPPDPKFIPDENGIASAVIQKLAHLLIAGSCGYGSAHADFMGEAAQLRRNMGAPIVPESAWTTLSPRLIACGWPRARPADHKREESLI